MQKGAILLAANNIIEEIFKSTKKASKCIREFYIKNRYAGAKDKKNIEFFIYAYLKNYFFFKNLFSKTLIEFNIRNCLIFIYFKAFDNDDLEKLYIGKYSLEPIKSDDAVYKLSKIYNKPILPDFPDWIDKMLSKEMGLEKENYAKAILKEGRLDLRVNGNKYSIEKVIRVLKHSKIPAFPTNVSPIGITLEKKVPLKKLRNIKYDYFEIQDEGSQIVTLLSGALPHMKVLDYCAGRGTKTLALYDMMNGQGELFAYEKDLYRFTHLKKRLKELKLNKIKVLKTIKNYLGYFDLVLLDVPCSGSGTWGRRPEELLRLNQSSFLNLLKIQAEILQKAALFCKIQGNIVYITCSIFQEENKNQILKFLKFNKNFITVNIDMCCLKNSVDIYKKDSSFVTLYPSTINTDGYFISILKRIG